MFGVLRLADRYRHLRSVILTGLLLAVGTAVGLAAADDISQAQSEAGENTGELGVGGAIALLVVLLIAYYRGGSVAGRMARFNGLRQAVAVWIWAVVITVATAGAIVALVLALIAALVGAILGGLAGMRFHRRVDRTGLDH
ncbi:hypothetical protein AB0J83_41805 [Actinoplanes sp. NPDC049596]|uniref:hypothetical protein n=1 Tax=unclassified Actinoplanes TaxID=2626549 RepID=UPI00341FCBD9